MRKVRRTESVAVLPTPPIEMRMTEEQPHRKIAHPSPVKAKPTVQEEVNVPPISTSPLISNTATVPPQSVTKRSLNDVNVEKDIFSKIEKSKGSYGYIPLSSGRMSDLWWKPLSCQVHEKMKGTSYPTIVINMQLFLDAPDSTISPNCEQMFVSCKADTTEVMKIAYVYHSLMRELHSERKLSYDEWYRNFTTKYKIEEIGEIIFASNVFNDVMNEVITRVPPTFAIFISKKPSLKYEYPDGIPMSYNRNSISCIGRSGFRYEFRSRLMIIPPVPSEKVSVSEVDPMVSEIII